MHTLQQNLEYPFALYQGRVVTRGDLWADVYALAKQLPNRPYVFNLCENRYLFCICLLAAAARQQICLLPPSGQISVIQEIMQDYPEAYLASETAPLNADLKWFEVKAPNSKAIVAPIVFDWSRSALIAFTSGSTGKPKPCVHSLQTFKVSADMALSSLALAEQQYVMISTTPPQHMYGLETSIFWPLFSQLILHDGRPFFTEDIRQAVDAAPWPAMLISTPTHLRLLAQSDPVWRNLVGVISATDTLSEKLAQQIQAILGQSPREIYGSTETLSFASREVLRESMWRPYTGSRLVQHENQQTGLVSPHLSQPCILPDNIRIEADGLFAVLGRHQDMLKISGKRASLTELNRRIKDIDGVTDGFCFVEHVGRGDDRLTAVLISQLSKQAIRQALQPYVDEVFLPRKIHFVTAIPRNQAGKLTQAEMDKLLAELKLNKSTDVL